LSRMRSPVTSRSNWTKDKSTLRVRIRVGDRTYARSSPVSVREREFLPGKCLPTPETGAAFLATPADSRRQRPHFPRLQRQSHGKSKTIPLAPGNRICAGLRGGAGRTRTCNQAIMSAAAGATFTWGFDAEARPHLRLEPDRSPATGSATALREPTNKRSRTRRKSLNFQGSSGTGPRSRRSRSSRYEDDHSSGVPPVAKDGVIRSG
jgi:hypothetical protein